MYAPLFVPLQRMAEPIPSLPPSFPPPEISSFWGTSIAITLFGTQEVLPTPVGRKYSTGSFSLTSSPSMILTHPPFSIALLAVALPLTSPLLPPLVPFPALAEVLQNLGSDHLPILLSIPLSSVFRPNQRPPSFNFQKAR